MPHPHARNLRIGRYSAGGQTYFLTKTLDRRHEAQGFSQRQCADVAGTFRSGPETQRFHLHAFVVMPDHWHALLSLPQAGNDLRATIHWICHHASFPSHQRAETIIWSEGYHDHRLRKDERVSEMRNYIEANPVRAGLTETPERWPYSSAHPDAQPYLTRDWFTHDRWD